MEHHDDLEIAPSPSPGTEAAQLVATIATGLDRLATILERGLRDLRLVMWSAAECDRNPHTTGSSEDSRAVIDDRVSTRRLRPQP
jgi:hypothetical protein